MNERLTTELFRQVAKSQKRDGFKQPPEVWQSVVNRYLALPALRGFWPMSSVDYTAANRAIDLSGQGNHLTDNNTVEFGYDGLSPYVHFTRTNSEYLSRADGGAGNWADITGGDLEILSTYRGLTFGGWFYIDSDYGTSQLLIGKVSGGGVNRSYNLSYITGTQFPQFQLGSGAVNYAVSGTAGTTGSAAPGAWYFYAARFNPSTEMKVWLNNRSNTNVVGMPATINDTTAAFTIGATAVPGNYVDGRASMCFLCAAQLSDAIILSLFEQTRAIYGV